MEFELRKLAIQFLLIVALGAVIAFQVDGAKRRIELAARKHQYEVDNLTSIIARLDRQYRAVKRERRSLRLVQDAEKTYEACRVAMVRLDETKEDIEALAAEMDYFQSSTPAEMKKVHALIERMENYLKPLEKEWAIAVATPPQSFNITDHDTIARFRNEASTGKSSFPHGFRQPYLDARAILLQALTSMQT